MKFLKDLKRIATITLSVQRLMATLIRFLVVSARQVPSCMSARLGQHAAILYRAVAKVSLAVLCLAIEVKVQSHIALVISV